MNRLNFHIGWLTVAFVVAATMSSCLVGPKLQNPEMATEEQYRFDSLLVDSIGDLVWWELFPDTQLYNLVETALTENKIVQQAVANIEEASAAVGFRKADQWPQFDAQIAAQRTSIFQGQNLGGAQNLFVVAPTVNWEIDFWGKYRHATRAARNELLASQYGQRAILLDLVAAVVENYVLMLQFESQLEIALQTLESRIESTRIIQARYNRGTVAEIDLNQAQIQEEIAAAAVPFFERQIGLIENAISILLGDNPRAIERGNWEDLTTPPEIPPGIPSQLLARRPDIMQQYHLLAAQNEYIGVAVAQRLPNINFSALFGAAGSDLGMMFSSDGVVWTIGGSLLQPIFQFGKNLRRVEVEEAKLQQQLKSYENTVIEAYQEVEDALVNIDTYNREVQARVRQRDAASNAKRLSRMRYDGGQTSYLEVLDSERSLFDAELATAEVQALHILSYLDLYKALGGGWLTAEEREAERAARDAQEEIDAQLNNN